MKNEAVSGSPILILLVNNNVIRKTPPTCYLKVRDSRTFKSLCADSEFNPLKADWLAFDNEHSAHDQISYLAARVRFPGADQKKSGLGRRDFSCVLLTVIFFGAHSPIIVSKFTLIACVSSSLQFLFPFPSKMYLSQ